MCQYQLRSFRQRLQVTRQSKDLYFASLLDRQTIAAAFGEASGLLDSARISTTAVTLWIFLSQVLSIDHGCVSAVARLVHYRCARDKLSETAMHRLVATTGQSIENEAPDQWLWLGHRVVTADGTTLTTARKIPQPCFADAGKRS